MFRRKKLKKNTRTDVQRFASEVAKHVAIAIRLAKDTTDMETDEIADYLLAALSFYNLKIAAMSAEEFAAYVRRQS